jgi:two-component system cell cycle sensor histidine kinase/response regulator CckA
MTEMVTAAEVELRRVRGTCTGRMEPAEQTVPAADDCYRSLTEGALYGIYRSTIDGRFLTVNPALVEMLGYESQDELLAVEMARDVYARPEERGRLIASYRDKERVEGQDVEWRRKDGTQITVRLSGRTVRNRSGQVECFEMIVEDVTERRALEAQLRQSQKMEAVGQLTGGIAHDFNNILTIILANADLLECDLPMGRPDLRAVLNESREAAQRGAALIRKLLGFSRRSKLEMKSVDLARLVSDMSGMLRRVLPENVDVEVRAEEPIGNARADSGAVEQILLNLATNARDAMPDGGRLTIEVKPDWLDEGYHAIHPWVEPGSYVSITVTDAGIGMDEATKERIFEPFYTTKPPERGTGLGLAMIYGLVKQHKGHIHVYSELGRGTTIKVYFPVTNESSIDSQSPREETQFEGGSERILVVEDELAIGRATRRALESHGYRVLLAQDGEEALEVVRKRGSTIDLIVTDLVMPRLGGRQLYEALQAEGFSIPVMFASGYSQRDIQECAELDQVVPFLHKPWTLAELLRAVREALGPAEKVGGSSSAAKARANSGKFRAAVPPVTVGAWMG